MTLEELINLYEGVTNEAELILDKVHEVGRITIKPGSPALAVLYGYEEVIHTLFRALSDTQSRVREAVDF